MNYGSMTSRDSGDDGSMTTYDVQASRDPARFVAHAVERITNFTAWYTTNIRNAILMRNFTYVDQWEPGVRSARQLLQRPVITLNQVEQLTKTTISEFSESEAGMQIFPRSKYAKQDRVDLMQGLVNGICYDSNAQEVYNCALKDAVDCGYGAMLALIEYESFDSFNVIIKLHAIQDVLNCSWDTGSESKFKTDGDYCSVQCMFSHSEFKRRWPKANISAAVPLNYLNNGNSARMYATSDGETCYITHYFYKVYRQETLYKINKSGKVFSMTKDDYKKYTKNMKRKRATADRMRPHLKESAYRRMHADSEIGKVIDSRQTTTFKIRHAMLTSQEVLEDNPFPGQKLPLVYVDGLSVIISGVQVTRPMSWALMDAQRMVNFNASIIAESLLTSRKEQYFVAKQLMKSKEVINAFKNPGNILGAIPYDMDPNAPQVAPIPISAPPFSSAYLQAMSTFSNMVDEISGRGEDIADLQRAAVSGVGMTKSQMKGNLARGIYADNTKKSIAELGRVVVGMIPETYDTEREVTIMGKMNQPKTVTINRQNIIFEDDDDEHEPYEFYKDEDSRFGIENDVVHGTYSVGVTSGSSFAANRELELQQLNVILKMSESPSFPLFADILVSLLNIKDVPVLYKRMRENVVPPQIVAEEDHQPPPPPPPPSPEEQLAKMKMMTGFVSDIYKSKADMKQADLDTMKSMMELIEQVQKTKASQASADATAIKALAADSTAQMKMTGEIMRMTNEMQEQDSKEEIEDLTELMEGIFGRPEKRKRAPENVR